MATTTTKNYGFTLPDADEFIKPDNFNDNFSNLDSALKAVSDVADAANSKSVTVDATPTDGSNNPVSSNGVYDAITDINGRFNTHTHTKSQITDFPTKLSAFTNDEGFKKHVSTTVTLATTAWNSSTKKASASVSAVTASNDVFVSFLATDDTNWKNCTKAGIRCSAQAAGSLAFTADTVPTASVTLVVEVVG